MLNRVTVLSRNEVELIHSASLEILESVGCYVPHDAVLEALEQTGARVYRASYVVKFPPALVERSIENAAKEFSLYGRDRTNPVHFGRGQLICLSTAGQYSWIDERDGTRRNPTSVDAKKAIRLSDALEHINWVGGMAVPTDIHNRLRDIWLMAELIRGTTKPGWAWVNSGPQPGNDCYTKLR